MNSLQIVLFLSAISIAYSQKFGGCWTPDQYKGECVYFKNCPSLMEIRNRKPPTTQDRLFLSLSQCGFRDGQPLVCCRETAPPPPVTQPPPVNRPSQLPQPGECGIDADDRIYGGNRTKIEEFPWMVLLQYSKPNNKKGFHCGGVLINPRYVLTASHCVNGKDLPTTWSLSHVRLGEWDLQTDVDCDDSYVNEQVCNQPPVDIAIEQKIPHEQYNPQASSQHNDIALLRLAENVRYNSYIRPICLPLKPELRANKLVGKTLNVAGWGKTEKLSQSNVKLKVNINGVTNQDCQNVYRQENREIIDSQICAGGEKGFDSCRGDSGGPLMRQDETGIPPYWYLAGLVSYGPSPCGQAGWPGVYTRVANYVDWIEATVKP